MSHAINEAADIISATYGKLTITYPYNVMTPLMRPFFTNGQLVIRVESAMKNEGSFSSE